MPLDNTLNVSELFRRLGIKGDSLGSAPLLESLRLSLTIGDLSALVPPLGAPIGVANLGTVSGVGTFNKWTLQCRSPGGLTVRVLTVNLANIFDLWVTPANPFGAATASEAGNMSFGQAVLSTFSIHPPAGKVAPVNTYRFHGIERSIPTNFDNWVGPGEFFNIEAGVGNVTEAVSILWKEYPGAINPG